MLVYNIIYIVHSFYYKPIIEYTPNDEIVLKMYFNVCIIFVLNVNSTQNSNTTFSPTKLIFWSVYVPIIVGYYVGIIFFFQIFRAFIKKWTKLNKIKVKKLWLEHYICGQRKVWFLS